MAEYIKTKLKSMPDIEVQVPKEYDNKAKQLIDTALDDPAKLIETLDEHPYLTDNIGILSRTKQLMEESNPTEIERLKDVVYLRIAIYGNTKLFYSQDENERRLPLRKFAVQQLSKRR